MMNVFTSMTTTTAADDESPYDTGDENDDHKDHDDDVENGPVAVALAHVQPTRTGRTSLGSKGKGGL